MAEAVRGDDSNFVMLVHSVVTFCAVTVLDVKIAICFANRSSAATPLAYPVASMSFTQSAATVTVVTILDIKIAIRYVPWFVTAKTYEKGSFMP